MNVYLTNQIIGVKEDYRRSFLYNYSCNIKNRLLYKKLLLERFDYLEYKVNSYIHNRT